MRGLRGDQLEDRVRHGRNVFRGQPAAQQHGQLAVRRATHRRQVRAPQDRAALADALEFAFDAPRDLRDQLVGEIAALRLHDSIEMVHAERHDARRGRAGAFLECQRDLLGQVTAVRQPVAVSK